MQKIMQKKWGVSEKEFTKHDKDIRVAFSCVCMHFDKSRQVVNPEKDQVKEETVDQEPSNSDDMST